MNLHPIIVHFPIACLVLYTIFECLSFLHKGFREKFGVTKISLLVVGVIAAFVSLQTGEVAESIFGTSDLIHWHSEFGEMSYNLYLILLMIYIISRETIAIKFPSKALHIVGKIIASLKRYGIIALISLIGFVLLSITGALGGAISHGPDTDPVVQFVYDLIVK